MRLYLVRHGEYILNDPDKTGELSPKGIADVTKIAEFIQPLQLNAATILHSGKPRAKQTAEILAQKGFATAEPPKMQAGLNPEDAVAEIISEIIHWGDDVVLVGHLPFMGRFLSKLIVNDETKEIVTFQAGTIVCVEGDPVSIWSIRWMLSPSLFESVE